MGELQHRALESQHQADDAKFGNSRSLCARFNRWASPLFKNRHRLVRPWVSSSVVIQCVRAAGHRFWRAGIPRWHLFCFVRRNSFMSWLLSIIFAASAVTCAFFHPLVAWLVIALPELFLIWMSISLTGRQWTWNQCEQLSDDAKAMFQKYGHFYSMPHAASDFSAASSLLWKANIALIAVS